MLEVNEFIVLRPADTPAIHADIYHPQTIIFIGHVDVTVDEFW